MIGLLASSEALDVISINIWQMLISMANLFILFLILKRFLFKPVSRILNERHGEVDAIYAEAEGARAESEAAKQLYTERLAKADGEAEEILRAAAKRAKEKEEQIVADAREEAGRLRSRAHDEIEQEKKKAVNEMKDEIARVSIEIAEEVLSREIGEDDHHALVDQFISAIEDNGGSAK